MHVYLRTTPGDQKVSQVWNELFVQETCIRIIRPSHPLCKLHLMQEALLLKSKANDTAV